MAEGAAVAAGRPVDVVRQAVAPVVAVVAAGLSLATTASLSAVLRWLDAYAAVSGRFVGILAIGVAITVLAAGATLVLSRSVGGGVFLAAGAVAAVLGTVAGRGLDSGGQLLGAAVLCGLGAGLLAGGAACMPFELSWQWARPTAAAWAVPLAAGWPAQAWFALESRQLSLVVGQLRPLVYLGAIVVAGWGIATALARPPQARSATGAGWRQAWWALGAAVAALCVLTALLGLDPGLRLFWLRPVVFVGAALALAVWVLVSMVVPTPAGKVSFLAVSFVAAAYPTASQVLVLAEARTGALPPAAASSALAIALAAAGGVLGYRRPRRAVVGGLVGFGVTAALAWPGFGSGWLPVALVALLGGCGSAVVAGGCSLALESEAALRLTAFAFVCGLGAGLLLATPLSWALLGDLPVTAAAARADARVVVGLVFSAAMLVAAHAAVVGHRVDRRRRGRPHHAPRATPAT